MARGQIVTVEGLSDLEEALSELSKATAKNVLRRALTEAGEHIREDAQARAPKGETLRLSESVSVGTKLSPRQKSQHVKESDVEVFIGPAPSSKSITQEFGAAHHAAQPYMRPAWDANKTQAAESIAGALATEIDKAAQRAARKAARLAAKMKL